MPEDRALLLIADIGGYTRFMTVHRINLAHAQVTVATLLEGLIDAAKPVFNLSKLEGDAAFFYAPIKDTTEITRLAQRVATIEAAFVETRRRMDQERLCSCDACTQVGQLKLKFVAHLGEVAYQKVKRMTELAGVPVIVVHRMLKNDVPIKEYVLVTEEIFEALPADVRTFGKPQEQDLEGIGKVGTHYIDLREIAQHLPAVLAPRTSLLRQLLRWARLTLRSLPFMAGLSAPCAGFNNMAPVLLPEAAPTPAPTAGRSN